MKDGISIACLCMAVGFSGALLFLFLAFMSAVGWGVYWDAFTKDIFKDFFSLWPLLLLVFVTVAAVSSARNR